MNYYLTLILLLWVYFSSFFILSIFKKRNDIVDIAWGIGFILASWSSLFLSSNYSPKHLLVSLLITLWGLRLALHIYSRNRNKKEDYRYLAWRKEWGKNFYLRSYLQIYMLQAFLLLLVVSPVLILNHSTSPSLNPFDILAFSIWLLGFIFEAVSDYQLSRFISNPKNKGQIIQSGLWRYSRHPNYFGEVTLWWGIFIFAFSSTINPLTLIGPLTITTLILFVSGIPLLEKKYDDNPQYLEYRKKTSIFFPLPPKS